MAWLVIGALTVFAFLLALALDHRRRSPPPAARA
jgi:hypothetical protein